MWTATSMGWHLGQLKRGKGGMSQAGISSLLFPVCWNVKCPSHPLQSPGTLLCLPCHNKLQPETLSLKCPSPLYVVSVRILVTTIRKLIVQKTRHIHLKIRIERIEKKSGIKNMVKYRRRTQTKSLRETLRSQHFQGKEWTGENG